MSFKNFFKKIYNLGSHPAHLPYNPTPPVNKSNVNQNQFANNINNDGLSYTDSEADVDSISGMSINFGSMKSIGVDNNGQTRDLSKNQNHIVGSGKLVSSIQDVAGICPICQGEAIHAFEKKLITLEEAQIKSLYDVNSASRCDICGTNTCSRHCRPVQMPDGSTQNPCVTCLKLLKKQAFKRKMIHLLLSPFFETKRQKQE